MIEDDLRFSPRFSSMTMRIPSRRFVANIGDAFEIFSLTSSAMRSMSLDLLTW